MTSLYQLRENYNEVLGMLYDEEMDEQTIIDTLESIEDAIEDKADSYAFILRDIDTTVSAIKAEEDRLKSRRMTLERRKERMKASLFDAMKVTGKTKFSTQLFSFNIRKNGGKRALVYDCSVDELPPELQKVTVEPNNEAIRNVMVDGVCQWAHLAEQGEHLEVK